MIRTTVSALFLVAVLGACQKGPDYRSSGDCCPTVAGSAGARFAGYREAREAFTRTSQGGILTATLKDASWLKYEGQPEKVMEDNKDYFEYVYTSFEVVLRPIDFTKPSDETFVLEDSSGVRLSGSPFKYEAAMIPVEDRHQFTFDIAFNHRVTGDLTWIRLTRVIDGETIEWTFTEDSDSALPSRGG